MIGVVSPWDWLLPAIVMGWWMPVGVLYWTARSFTGTRDDG